MKFIFYCLCGLVGVSADFFIYSLFVFMGAWYQIANIAGYLSGTTISFFLNRKITFRVFDTIDTRFRLFFAVASVGFLSSSFALWIMIDIFKLDANIAKLLTLPFVVILQYSLNRRFTFKEI